MRQSALSPTEGRAGSCFLTGVSPCAHAQWVVWLVGLPRERGLDFSLCPGVSALLDLCKLNVFMTWLFCTAFKFQLTGSLKSLATWHSICKLLKIQAQVSFVYDSWTKRSKWSKMFYNSCFLDTQGWVTEALPEDSPSTAILRLIGLSIGIPIFMSYYWLIHQHWEPLKWHIQNASTG